MTRCLNCGSTQIGKYCQSCGQDAHETKRPITSVGVDALTGSVGYDAKIWKTLISLLARPGYLTNEFIAGRRVRNFNPRKMYFFVSIVFFLLFAVFKDSRLFAFTKDPRTMDRAEILRSATEMANTANRIERFWSYVEVRVIVSHQLQHLQQMDPELLRERFSRSVANNVPRMFFLLLPVFALVVMLLHRKQKRYYIEHLVFAFHAHIYVFLIASMALVYEHFSQKTQDARVGLLLTLPYLLLSQHAVYREGWALTAVKLVSILAIYGAILLAGVVLLVAITFWLI